MFSYLCSKIVWFLLYLLSLFSKREPYCFCILQFLYAQTRKYENIAIFLVSAFFLVFQKYRVIRRPFHHLVILFVLTTWPLSFRDLFTLVHRKLSYTCLHMHSTPFYRYAIATIGVDLNFLAFCCYNDILIHV